MKIDLRRLHFRRHRRREKRLTKSVVEIFPPERRPQLRLRRCCPQRATRKPKRGTKSWLEPRPTNTARETVRRSAEAWEARGLPRWKAASRILLRPLRQPQPQRGLRRDDGKSTLVPLCVCVARGEEVLFSAGNKKGSSVISVEKEKCKNWICQSL